ncbi:GlxA family transcriptional regulator [uncultured Sulfitobacter sp.]|uniref:GlxA family transcriptional regulator n=1 Tax=uncultured Sulfitobacter sp. TaxID=191468 RepID=UPI00262DB936|nr:GlxA family transcriptional regulator [uncultured Sulfitobacter sp.]
MQNWKNVDSADQDFDILLFDQFSNHCLANTIEPMRAANGLSRHAQFRWRFVSLDGALVESSSGMQVTPHSALKEGRGSTLVIMPSYGFRRFATWATTQKLRAAAKRYGVVAGLDTGSWLMAHAGLLEGYRATIHWDEWSSFAEAFPQVRAERERFVIDRDRITCSGAMAAFDLVVHLIGQAHGPLLALKVAHLFMRTEGARGPIPFASRKGKLVDRAITVMSEHLEKPLSIAAVARAVGISQKTLENRMRTELDVTPQTAYRMLRLTYAHKLVTETDQSVSEIAGRCGYENASAMTRAFKAEFQETPRGLRIGG